MLERNMPSCKPKRDGRWRMPLSGPLKPIFVALKKN